MDVMSVECGCGNWRRRKLIRAYLFNGMKVVMGASIVMISVKVLDLFSYRLNHPTYPGSDIVMAISGMVFLLFATGVLMAIVLWGLEFKKKTCPVVEHLDPATVDPRTMEPAEKEAEL